MSDDWKDDRSPEETAALRGLYADASPAESLEDRTVDGLRRSGLLAHAPAPWRARVGRVLVPAALFVLGFALGRVGGGGEEPSGHADYMLLLFEGPRFQTPSQIDEGSVVQEYRDWGVRLASEGRVVSGARLGRDRRILSPISAPSMGAEGDRLAGYFLIESESLEDAVRLAESHPHRKYGGVIEVRAIAVP